MKTSMFHRPKPRQFNYKPVYYNPKEDEMEAKRKAMGLSENMNSEERIRARLRYQWEKKREKAKVRRQQNTRIILYIAVIAALIYMIYSGKFF